VDIDENNEVKLVFPSDKASEQTGETVAID